MPLTFSHPAIVLPLNYLPKRWVSLTGLIVGSVTPDFEYFGRFKVSSIYSHTWPGLFWFDLPLAMLLTFVYHDIVREPFLANMPNVLRSRFNPYGNFNWDRHFRRNAVVVTSSIIIGVASHLFWDSFTHASGYFVKLWQMDVPVEVFKFQMPFYKLIQHLSTVAGGLIIILAIYSMPRTTMQTTHVIWPYWFIVTGLCLLTVAIRLITGLSIHQYWNIIVTLISGGILGVVIASVIMKLKHVLLIRWRPEKGS